MQLEDQVVGRVLDHADLLEDHPPLELEILGAEQWAKDQVGDDIGGMLEVLVEHARLIRRVLAGGVGVERAAERLQGQGDVLRAPRGRPLEHHVLEEMRHPHPIARLVHGRRADPRAECDRPYSRHVLGEYGQPVRQDSPVKRALRVEGLAAHRRVRPRDERRGPRSAGSTPGLPSPSCSPSPPRAARGSAASRRCSSWRRGRSPPRSPRPPRPPPFPSSSVAPSGFGRSAFIERRSRPRSSRSSSFTFTRSPFFTTSSVFSVRPCLSSEMCTSPSLPGMISTNAPNAVVLLTAPSYVSPITGSAVSDLMIAFARSSASPPTAAIVTRPVSSTVISAPVSSWMPRMVLPFGPMRSPIFSGLICTVTMRGAYGERSARGCASALFISPRMCSRASFACASASRMILRSSPSTLMSIWIDVIPASVPATLKSMSPR